MLNIAHRGAGGYSPHNSRQAFSQAISLQADMIETDIRVTRDNIPVLFHDKTTSWGPVADLNWSELKNYPLPNGEFMPSLEEILQIFGAKIAFNFEIKYITSDKIEPIERVLNKYSLIKPLVSSFSCNIINHFSNSFETALLIDNDYSPEYLLTKLENSGSSYLNLYYPLLKPTLCSFMHKNSFKIIIWTDFVSELFNPLPLFMYAYHQGCDGFITGKPDLLYYFLKKANKESQNHILSI